MSNLVLWQQPDLPFPEPFDTIFFDVDGVLIKTTESFRATDIAVAEYIVGTILKLDWGKQAGTPLVGMDDVAAFKQAGGFNDDLDMSYLLVSLFTARLREWKGSSLAQRSIREWATLARTAQRKGKGGLAWVREVMPESAQPEMTLVHDLFLEYYWGAENFKHYFGRQARYRPEFAGFVQKETMLFSAEFPARLRASGIKHLGMITGRVGPEVEHALERMAAHVGSPWWDVVITADTIRKPDPRALYMAMKETQTQGGLYIGDTADDLDLVLNYAESRKAHDPVFLAAMVVHQDEIDLYSERGANILVSSVEGLLSCIPGKVY